MSDPRSASVDDFLKTRGDQFNAAIVTIDAVGSSRYRLGDRVIPDRLIAQTKAALRDLVETVFRGLPAAVFPWQGDGGVVLFDGAAGYDSLIVHADALLAQLSLFNRSRGRLNFLPSDVVHLRIAAHCLSVENTRDAGILTHHRLDSIIKYEREVGVVDHLVVTDALYSSLGPDLRARMDRRAEPHPVLGTCYVLDPRLSIVEGELSEKSSPKIREWIASMVSKRQYDELCLFSYTNETLVEYLGHLNPSIKIKVLARSWVTEAKEEADQRAGAGAAGEGSTEPRRTRMKSAVIRTNAESLMERAPRGQIDIRFYDAQPWIKGALFRDTVTGRAAAHVGFYTWDCSGGPPFVGDPFAGIWLSSPEPAATGSHEETAKGALLRAVASRFDQLWTTGHTFAELELKEIEERGCDLREAYIRDVWEVNEAPYLLVMPGRRLPGRPFPSLAAEDVMAFRCLERLLHEAGAHVDIEIMTEAEHSEHVRNWGGHIIFVCSRTLTADVLGHLETRQFPYRFLEDHKVRHQGHRATLESPIDWVPPEPRDLCVVGKVSREDPRHKIFVISGLHALGTLGGAEYLTSSEGLAGIVNKVGGEDFAALVGCVFGETYQVKRIDQVFPPEALPPAGGAE